MGKMSVPTAPVKKTTVYGNFHGVDYSVDPSLVDKSRSPMCINMLSDAGGNPRKRKGWRVIQTLEAPVHNIWKVSINGEHTIVHAGTKIYEITSTGSKILSYDVSNIGGTGFSANYKGKSAFFILTGNEYLMYDGVSVKNVRDVAYVPTTVIARAVGSSGGSAYEKINLLQPRRIVQFRGDSTNTVCTLPDKNIDDGVIKVTELNSSGSWVAVASSGYTVDRTAGTVTLSSAHNTPVTGEDNLKIEYAKTYDGYADKITRCTIHAHFGYGQQNRVFVSGNPDWKAYDWYSKTDNPTYFEDLSYSPVGSIDTAIVGYQKLGDYLAIIKEDNEQDTTVFLRSGNEIDGETVFPLYSGVAGIGAVAKKSFATLNDEPLFLSRNGIYATTSTQIQYERSAKNRSVWVNKKLLKEVNLENACACVFGGYYLLAINSNVYVLDGKQRSSVSGETCYDCYFWKNVPAVCWCSHEEELWFGTSDGKVCRFNTDIDTMNAYNDNGSPIYACWATSNDSDGAVYLLKTMQKRGCLVTLSPFTRSSATVYISVDGDSDREICYGETDILDFNDIDFERFTFNSSDAPQEIYFETKIKKYKRMQIIVVNNNLNEGFGIHQIVKTYIYGNYAKR